MLNLELGKTVRQVLCLGAHCDDVEIGCGGLLASLQEARPAVRVDVVIFSSDAARARESRAALAKLLPDHRGLEVQLHEFRDGFFPAHWSEIKERFAELGRRVQPDLVLTHCEHDRHQDHRIVSELTWNTFRNHLVLEYEIPKFDGDLGRPSVYVPLSRQVMRRKIDALTQAYGSQLSKPWFTEDTFAGLMRLRGLECRAPEGVAEAFYARKVVLGL